MALSDVYLFKSLIPKKAAHPDDTPQMPSVAEENISAILRLERDALGHRTLADRIADSITGVATKPWFLAVHVTLFALWILGNWIGPWRFDPKPFNLLNTIIALEAIFLTLLVLASQHRMLRLSDRRSHINLQVDLLAEREMTVMIRMLERLFEHFKLDPAAAAPQSAELRKTTDLKALVEQLDSRLLQNDQQIKNNE